MCKTDCRLQNICTTEKKIRKIELRLVIAGTSSANWIQRK